MSAFSTVLQVRFGHVDPAGIAYFPRIYDYLHDVFEELWEEHVGQRYYHLLLERRIGFPLVHDNARYAARTNVQGLDIDPFESTLLTPQVSLG